jgi:hypothetical protein
VPQLLALFWISSNYAVVRTGPESGDVVSGRMRWTKHFLPAAAIALLARCSHSKIGTVAALLHDGFGNREIDHESSHIDQLATNGADALYYPLTRPAG